MHAKLVKIISRQVANCSHAFESTRTLSISFNVLSLTGVWLPLHWESRKSKKIAYQIFSAFMVLAAYVIVGLQIMLLVTSKIELNLFVDVMFTLLTGISIWFKLMNFLVRRKQVIQLREMLMEDCCMPRDDEERQMQKKIDEFIKNFTIGFNFVTQAILFLLLITPLINPDSSNRKLPYNLWLPYDFRLGWNYWITYGIESTITISGLLLTATTDVIVSGFILQTCTQLDILKHRFKQLPDLVKSKLIEGLPMEELQRNSIKQLVEHHNFLIKFVKKVTSTFDMVIVEQYAASVLLFSVIVYQLTLGDIPPLEKVMAFGYIICMTTELFAYCWCGNEITLKSLELGEEIYKMDWMILNKETQKSLRFIILRTSKPIIMSYGNLIVLNIDSFKAIMKVTYSAFNVLKRLKC